MPDISEHGNQGMDEPTDVVDINPDPEYAPYPEMSTLEDDLKKSVPTESTVTISEMDEIIRRMGLEQDLRLKALSVLIQAGVTDVTELIESARDIEAYLING